METEELKKTRGGPASRVSCSEYPAVSSSRALTGKGLGGGGGGGGGLSREDRVGTGYIKKRNNHGSYYPIKKSSSLSH